MSFNFRCTIKSNRMLSKRFFFCLFLSVVLCCAFICIIFFFFSSGLALPKKSDFVMPERNVNGIGCVAIVWYAKKRSIRMSELARRFMSWNQLQYTYSLRVILFFFSFASVFFFQLKGQLDWIAFCSRRSFINISMDFEELREWVTHSGIINS